MNIFTSFRDPAGRVFFDRQAVWRLVRADGTSDVTRFLEFVDTKFPLADNLIPTHAATPPEIEAFTEHFGQDGLAGSLFRHPRIGFPSFPYEWAPEMLQAAGELTLDLAEALLPLGWGLKDATPYNILFENGKPIFVDILSFEQRDAADPIWLPYSQFVKTFLLPLLANKKVGIPLKAIFYADRDGLDISAAYNYFSAFEKINPQVFSLVTLPNMLVNRAEGKSDLYESSRTVSPRQANFILSSTFRRLRRQLTKASPNPERRSKWTSYTAHNRSAIPEYMDAKQRFVESTVLEQRPANVMDVGCNTGYFSFFAARHGANVVAVDHDPAVVGQVWSEARREGLNVLPLVVDVSRPSPSMGWRYSELPSFLDRAIGHFDLVMMLAVIHHMIVQERVPLREVLRLAADLTTDSLIIEFVPPADPLFRHLARGREHLHADLNTEVFERTASEFFSIVRSEPLPPTDRTLYLMKKK